MRHISRPFRRMPACFSSAKAATPSAREPSHNLENSGNEERTRKWLQKLNQLTTSPGAKGYIGQLTTVINLLNRKAPDQVKVAHQLTQEIDWKSWNDKIITEGLVKKVQHNHDELSKQEYEVDRIAESVFKTESKAL